MARSRRSLTPAIEEVVARFEQWQQRAPGQARTLARTPTYSVRNATTGSVRAARAAVIQHGNAPAIPRTRKAARYA